VLDVNLSDHNITQVSMGCMKFWFASCIDMFNVSVSLIDTHFNSSSDSLIDTCTYISLCNLSLLDKQFNLILVEVYVNY